MNDAKNLILIMVGSGKKPLAIYSPFTGEFVHTCELTLSQVLPNTSAAINCGEFIIYYMNEDNISYLIMTSPNYPKSTAIGCIESVKKELKDILLEKDFDKINEYGLTVELEEKLKMKYEYFNTNTQVTSESLENLKNEMNKMKEEVFKANDQLMIRSEKVQEMENKANEMATESEHYKQGAIKVNKSSSKKKLCIFIALFITILIIVYAIICYICNSFVFECSSE